LTATSRGIPMGASASFSRARWTWRFHTVA
jgi:hypothetical protein